MTYLADLLRDPKSLSTRMRVGKIEPVALRRAVADLADKETSEAQGSDPDVAELQARIADLASANALDSLSRRDLRLGCQAILHPPNPPAANKIAVDGLLGLVERNRRRAAFFAVIDAYLDGFASEDENVLSLAKKLTVITARWPWRESDQWPAKIAEFSLLDPSRAPKLLAQRILEDGKRPRDIFQAAGLDTPGRRFGGLVESAFRHACHIVRGLKGQKAVDGQRILIEWASDDAGKFAYQRAWPDFVEASLLPWEVTEPSEAHKSALIEMLERFGDGDPRTKPARWRTVMDRAPGAYAVLMRWLTRASVLQFLDIVDRLMPDPEAKLMWAYRRAFWMSYLLGDGSAPSIDAAWVAFGDDGARMANRAARESGDNSFAAYGRQYDKSGQHAALILQMGDLTIVDWSHTAKYQVWKRGDKRIPELFKSMYSSGSLYCAPIQESHSSPSSYYWQKRLAQIIENRPFYSPKPGWKPKRA